MPATTTLSRPSPSVRCLDRPRRELLLLLLLPLWMQSIYGAGGVPRHGRCAAVSHLTPPAGGRAGGRQGGRSSSHATVGGPAAAAAAAVVAGGYAANVQM